MLEADALVAAATDKAGLDDFGSSPWRDGLDVLVGALNTEANLNELGEAIFTERTSNTLRQRLHVVEWLRRHSEIGDVAIDGPLIVIGLPRTGTTALSNMIGSDPETRAPRVWESAKPCPPPEQATVTADPRVAEAQAGIDMLHELKPIMRVIHDDDATSVAENMDLLAFSFRAYQFTGMARIPSFVEWWLSTDLHDAYALHRRVIQLLGWRCPPSRWHLRNPPDMFCLATVADVYPDARFVWCHRDPARVLASVCELVVEIRDLGSDDIDPAAIGREQLDDWSLAMDRALEARRQLGEQRFIDVFHHDLVADPVAALLTVYERTGWEVTDRTTDNAGAWVKSHDRVAHGEHQPELADYGLDAEVIRDRLGAYCEHFGV